MKKLTTLLAIFAIAGLGLTSCDQSGTDEIVYPSFEKVTLEERTDGTFFGRFDVTCAQTSSLKEVTASYTYGSTTISIPDQDLDITKGKNYEWTVKLTVPVEAEGTRVSKITLSATVKGSNGGTKSQSFDTPAKDDPTPEEPGETDLSAAAAFSFKRVGGQAATGDLSKFGLKWPENVLAATNVSLQKDGASKFVELAAADYHDPGGPERSHRQGFRHESLHRYQCRQGTGLRRGTRRYQRRCILHAPHHQGYGSDRCHRRYDDRDYRPVQALNGSTVSNKGGNSLLFPPSFSVYRLHCSPPTDGPAASDAIPNSRSDEAGCRNPASCRSPSRKAAGTPSCRETFRVRCVRPSPPASASRPYVR